MDLIPTLLVGGYESTYETAKRDLREEGFDLRWHWEMEKKTVLTKKKLPGACEAVVVLSDLITHTHQAVLRKMISNAGLPAVWTERRWTSMLPAIQDLRKKFPGLGVEVEGEDVLKSLQTIKHTIISKNSSPPPPKEKITEVFVPPEEAVPETTTSTKPEAKEDHTLEFCKLELMDLAQKLVDEHHVTRIEIVGKKGSTPVIKMRREIEETF